jgi:hypothetical protein
MNHRNRILGVLLASAFACGGEVIPLTPPKPDGGGGFDAETDTLVTGSGSPDVELFDAPEEVVFPTDALDELPSCDAEVDADLDSGVDSDLDSGVDSDLDSGACTPPATVMLTPVLHAQPPSADCTAAMVAQIISVCFTGTSTSACNALLASSAAYMTCATGCMETDTLTTANVDTASAAWGAIILVADQGNGDIGFINVGGCVAALDPSAAGQKCARDLEANTECLVTACSSCNVPTTDPTDAEVNDYTTCEEEAEPAALGSGPCGAYETAATADCAAETADASPGPGAPCFAASSTLNGGGTTQAELTQALTVLMGAICAPALLDGG